MDVRFRFCRNQANLRRKAVSMKLDPIRTFATAIGSTLLGGAIADCFAHDTYWVYVGAAIGLVCGLALTISAQRKNL